MSIKQIRITVGNESGTLMELTKVLADHDIELRAMNLVDIKDVRSLRIIVDAGGYQGCQKSQDHC